MSRNIIAWLIDGIISNDRRALVMALKRNAPIDYICSKRAKFMAACDFGKQWEELAALPSAFCITDAGEITEPQTERQPS